MKTINFSLASTTDVQTFDNLVQILRFDELITGIADARIRVRDLSGGMFDVEMKPGRIIKLPEVVRGFVITNLSAAALTGKLTYGTGDIQDSFVTGTVKIGNVNGSFTQVQTTVTNASAPLITDNAARRYLLIQNKDNGGDIYVTLNGTDATTANGIKIAAGGSMELQGYVPTGAVKAIGTLASNANIVTLEG